MQTNRGKLHLVKIKNFLRSKNTVQEVKIQPNTHRPGKISANPVYEDERLVVRVSVKAAETGQYRVGAWLLEDNIQGQQKGAPAGEENSWYHEYDDCIRIADSKQGAMYTGVKLGVIDEGKTAEKMFTWTLNDNWKVENLKLCIFVSVPDAAGRSYYVNNVITAPIDGIKQFEYAE